MQKNENYGHHLRNFRGSLYLDRYINILSLTKLTYNVQQTFVTSI